MAQVSYIDLTTEQEVPYFRGLTAQDRFTFSRVTRKVVFLSKKKVAGLTARSMLPIVATAWNALTVGEKADWTAAAAECGLNGYRLFVQDKCARIRNDLAGNATPNLFHQYLVGNLHIESPATKLKIVQLHPHDYWVNQKVVGKKGQYQPVVVTEDFVLPLEISLNYKASLIAAGPSPSARFYAKIWYSYQGVNIYDYVDVNLDISCAWKGASAVYGIGGSAKYGDGYYGVMLYGDSTIFESVARYGVGFYGDAIYGYSCDINEGYVVAYDLYIELNDVTGDLYIDNVKAEHSSQNWVRDTYCNDIDQNFTRAFYQIPKHWAVVDVPAGAWYNSEYKDF